MCPAHAPPSAPSSFSRWTDEEHDILVMTTNKQIEIEINDKSKEISWTKHWQRVSQKLQEHGYNRSSAACNGYWKRTVESQIANEEAAGPRWDDAEHQILVGMTEDQLALESEDPASVLTWPEHWEKVSLHLKENGYTRTVDACAAYWILVEHNSRLVTNNKIDGEYSIPEDDLGISPDTDSEGDTPSQKSAKAGQWTTDKSSTWSPVSVLEDTSISFDPTAVEETTSNGSPDIKSHPPMPSSNNQVSSSKPNPLSKSASNALELDFEISELESSGIQEAEKIMTSQNVYQSVNQPPAASLGRPKALPRGFRFTAPQKAYLQNEVTQNGSSPDAERREKMAKELGVEEKTIKNWFNHYRCRENRISMERRKQTFSMTPMDSPYVREVSSSDSKTKRKHDLLDGFESGPSVQTHDPGHSAKKSRLDDGTKSSIEPASVETAESYARILASVEIRNAKRMESALKEASLSNQISAVAEQLKSITPPVLHPEEPQRSKKAMDSKSTTPESIENKQGSKLTGEYLDVVFMHSSSSSSPEPDTPSLATHIIPSTESEEKAWASRKLQTFQSEIQSLERENAANTTLLTRIEQELQARNNESMKLEQQKAKETARILEEIEVRYKREDEVLKNKERKLGEEKQSWLERVKKNESEIARKRTGMQGFQTIIDYYSGLNVED